MASLACEYHTTARHWCAQNADHFATSSPFSAFFIEVVCDLGAIPPRTTAAPPPIGGNCIIRAATRRRYTASQFLMLQNPHRHRCGALRTGRRAWLRCPWAVAGPGWALNQRVQPHISDTAPLVWRAPEGPEGLAAVPVGGGGAWPGFETTRRAKLAARTARGRAAAHGHTAQPGPTGRASARNTRGATSNTINWAKQPGSTQQRARSAAAPRAPRVCQWLTG